MAVKISLVTNDIEIQNAKLSRFSAYAEDYYKKAMRSVINPTKAAVKAAAPKSSGAMAKAIGSTVSGFGSFVRGAVENGEDTWYGNVIEYGRHKTKKMPPVSIIAEKYGVPMNEAFLIARAIAASDAKARQPVLFFGKQREKAFELGLVLIAQANEKIVQDMVK